MEDAIKRDSPYRVSEAVAEGAELFQAAVKMGLEGIMAKERNSTYRPGTRSSQWLKIKKRQTLECLIIGYTEGKGTAGHRSAHCSWHGAKATSSAMWVRWERDLMKSR